MNGSCVVSIIGLTVVYLCGWFLMHLEWKRSEKEWISLAIKWGKARYNAETGELEIDE